MITMVHSNAFAYKLSYDDELFIPLDSICNDLGITPVITEKTVTVGENVLYLNKYTALKGNTEFKLSRPVQKIGGNVVVPQSVCYNIFGICYTFNEGTLKYEKSDKTLKELRNLPEKRRGIRERESYPSKNNVILFEESFDKGIPKNIKASEDSGWETGTYNNSGALYRNNSKKQYVLYNSEEMGNYTVAVKAVGPTVGVVGRANKSDTYYEAVYAGGKIFLNKYVNGGRSQLYDYNLIWDRKEMIDIKLRFEWENIYVYVDDTLRFSYKDLSSPIMKGIGGVVGAGETYFDDYRIIQETE